MKSNCPSLEYFSQWDVCQSFWRAQRGNWHALHCSSQSWMLHGTWATNRKFSEPWNWRQAWQNARRMHAIGSKGSGIVMQTSEGQRQVCWPSNMITYWCACACFWSVWNSPSSVSYIWQLIFRRQSIVYSPMTSCSWMNWECLMCWPLPILHQIAGSAVLNIKDHDLCRNFCCLLHNPLLELEAVLPLSPDTVEVS